MIPTASHQAAVANPAPAALDRLARLALAGWVLAGRERGACAATQTALLIAMNAVVQVRPYRGETRHA